MDIRGDQMNFGRISKGLKSIGRFTFSSQTGRHSMLRGAGGGALAGGALGLATSDEGNRFQSFAFGATIGAGMGSLFARQRNLSNTTSTLWQRADDIEPSIMDFNYLKSAGAFSSFLKSNRPYNKINSNLSR